MNMAGVLSHDHESGKPFRNRAPHDHELGFTLLEVMVSLGLFGLIAVAGLAMVDGILKVQSRTEVRLDRLSDLQRATFAISSDLEQLTPGEFKGEATQVEFRRSAPGLGGLPVSLKYGLQAGTLFRFVEGRPQQLLSGVSAVRWRYLGTGWSANWPLDPEVKGTRPRAVEVTISLAKGPGLQGDLRRVIPLPAVPKEDSE